MGEKQLPPLPPDVNKPLHLQGPDPVDSYLVMAGSPNNNLDAAVKESAQAALNLQAQLAEQL